MWSWHDNEECWKPHIDQLIAWDSDPKHGQVVVDWRLYRDGITVRRDFATGEYVARWWDGNRFREVRAKSFRHLDSDYDRELDNRDAWPNDRRRRFSK